jgi:energy-coupling factor transporter ATP-binding protein EcfA2
VLGLVDLGELGDRRAGALSHGQLKRVGVAQAFLGAPDLILLDEPTAGLDPRHAHDLRELIRSQRGTRTIVVSSHNLQELEAICDEAAFMEKGLTDRVRRGRRADRAGTPRSTSSSPRAPSPSTPCRRPRHRPSPWPGTPRKRTLRVRFVRRHPDRVAEDVIAEVLRELLAGWRPHLRARQGPLARGSDTSSRAPELRSPARTAAAGTGL